MDAVIDSLIRPPVRRCTGADDPLGLNGEAAWHLTDLLVPRGLAERANLLKAGLRPTTTKAIPVQ